jgi:hypothetical protein
MFRMPDPVIERIERLQAAYPAASDAIMTAIRQVDWLLEACAVRGLVLEDVDVFLGNDSFPEVEVNMTTRSFLRARHVNVSLELQEPGEGAARSPKFSVDLAVHHDMDDGTAGPTPTALILYVCFAADVDGTTSWRLMCDDEVDASATEGQRRLVRELGFALDGALEVTKDEARRVADAVLDEVVVATRRIALDPSSLN